MKSTGQIFIFSILKTFTEIFFLTFCLLHPCQQARGQVIENFNDNDLTQNPLWLGQLENFKAVSGILHLAAPAETGSTYISTLNTEISEVSWQVTLELQFNPSASNFCRVYLYSDSADLNNPLNGYFVMIGNSTDEVSLYRQTGSEKIEIIDGLDGRISSDIVKLTFMVTRSAAAGWELFVDPGNTGQLTLEGSAVDSNHSVAFYTGLQCVYTSTRSDKFYFDEFFIRRLEDTNAPEIRSVNVLSPTNLEIDFSEIPDATSAKSTLNYKLQNATPQTIETIENSTAVVLIFAQEFTPGVNHLFVNGVKDRVGNLMIPDTITFAYVPSVVPEFKDIVISEFMADPSPRKGLPESEYIELYNRSSKTFNLSHWKISDGNTLAILEGELLFPPQEYLIICPTETVDSFLPFANVIGVKNFPSLNNAGDYIILSNNQKVTIDSLHFSDSWYKDSSKKEGGWSLEIIDPDNLCSASQNWIASDDITGGTPGKLNSSDAENPDLKGPLLQLAYLVFPDTVKLIFDEPLSKDLPGVQDFVFSPERKVTHIESDHSLTTLTLVTTPQFDPGTALELTLSHIFDCSGNELQTSSRQVELFMPEAADSADVVLNEVLFNPRPDGVDFIELFNTSSKYIDLRDWSVANFADGQITNAKRIMSSVFIRPGDYVALSPSSTTLLSQYPSASERHLSEVELPTLSDDQGNVALVDPNGKIFDVFFYSDDMHSLFLKDTEGVSLERLSVGETSNPENWKSCSTSFNATPGVVNSNHVEAPDGGNEIFINPEVFIPITGQPDFALIEYNFQKVGLVGNVKIYDQQGRLVKVVAENELLGSSGFFRWDGDRDNGMKATIGPYMIIFQLFDAHGFAKTIRRRVAVAGHF